jgi:hypothetical protein
MNHNRKITIGDRNGKDDPWLDKEIAKIRDQRLKQRQQAKKQAPKKK